MQHPLRCGPTRGPKHCIRWLPALLLLWPVHAADYLDHHRLTEQLKELAGAHTNLVRMTNQGSTPGKREIWLLELGTGPEQVRKRRPALLLVAGIEGNDLVGTFSLVSWARRLADGYSEDEPTKRLLDTTTLYIFPQMNPDAAESFFARPRLERTTNLTPVDEDHDGLVDEDGPEDLNGDGLITSMRIEDPEGEYILDPKEPRLLIRADRSKGERGVYKLLSEGLDNDKDEQWNEDSLGGVNLNRNFPYRYEFFAPPAGPHQVSELETRALADFVVAHPNIGIVFTFGAADNLLQTPKSEPSGKRPPGAISDPDLPYYRELGRLYRSALGAGKELTGAAEPGSFSDWMYFHRGRLSLAARPWTPQLQLELDKPSKVTDDKDKATQSSAKEADSNASAGAAGGGKAKPSQAGGNSNQGERAAAPKSSADKRGEEERAALKWFDTNAPEAFLPWKEITHPDFPKEKVEVGGWAPFARSNPPVKLLEPLAEKHGKFLTDLARKLPRIGLRKAEATHLGNGIFELTVQVENTGYLATALAQGALTREVLPTRVVVHLDKNQFLAGQRLTLLSPIAGSGGMEEVRYVLRARGKVELEVISALGGSVRQTVELKEVP